MLRLIDCIEAVGFDLDGTLIDTAPDLADAANMMLLMLGGRMLSERRIAALIGDGVDTFVGRVLEESRGRSKLDPALEATASTFFRDLYGQRLFARGRIFPGVEQTLQEVENAALPLCCITNKESRFALPLLDAAGLRERFAVTVCADRPNDRKPSATMLLAACHQLGIEARHLLYVGDSPSDVAAARAARCRVVAVSYGYREHCVLAEARPDGIVGDLTKITSIGIRANPCAPALRVVS